MYRLVCIALLALAISSGCSSEQHNADSGVKIDVTTDPSPPKVGVSKLTLDVRDADGKPAGGATLKLEGNMSHAGMKPVFADAKEGKDGKYTAEMDFTMAGDWFVLVTGKLADGRKVEKKIDVKGVKAKLSATPHAGFDLLRLPLLGSLLRWRHVRLALQLPLLALAVVLVLHGLLGPDIASHNLATLLTWVHYRGLLVLAILAAGNVFCMGCPLLLPRELARMFVRPALVWPTWLRSKWLAVCLFVAVLFCYEYFALWQTGAGTALLILAYFVTAFVVDSLFRHASFCKWVCPIGQFNFLASTLSPLEVKARDLSVCSRCETKDCIKGSPAPIDTNRRHSLPLMRGCELALFVPRKVGNLDCTFCMDCVHACPHDNIGLIARVPGEELEEEGTRSGIGEPHRRGDWAALAVAFTFGALVNAFAMVSPVYAFMGWLSDATGIHSRGGLLGVLFTVALVIEPALLLGIAASLTREKRGILATITRYAPALIPLGFGIWLAHYSFHFLTGILTVIPVTQNAACELGITLLGKPQWQFGGLPDRYVYPTELGFLALGLVGSLLVSWKLARSWARFIPWAVLYLLLTAAAVWLMSQPMEMRGTYFG